MKDVGGQPGKAHVSPRVLNKALLFLASFVKYIRNHPMGGDVRRAAANRCGPAFAPISTHGVDRGAIVN